MSQSPKSWATLFKAPLSNQLNFLACLALIFFSTGVYARDVVWIPESEASKIIIEKKVPIYPAGKIYPPGGSVAVGIVFIEPNGLVSKVRVVDAPDIVSARALKSALKGWKFKENKDDNVVIASKLTFYFLGHGHGDGKVFYASDAPYVGPQNIILKGDEHEKSNGSSD